MKASLKILAKLFICFSFTTGLNANDAEQQGGWSQLGIEAVVSDRGAVLSSHNSIDKLDYELLIGAIGPSDGTPSLDQVPNRVNWEVDYLVNGSQAAEDLGFSFSHGLDSEECWVTNLLDSGEGSLRSCLESYTSSWVRFAVSGTIYTDNYLYIKSNKAVDGRGVDITLSGENGIACFSESNIIIHNIKFDDIGSGIRLREQCSDVWVDHVSFSNIEDESIAIDQGSTNVVVSWSRFTETPKSVLIGSSHRDYATEQSYVLMHNNWFGAEQRNPNIRYAHVHAYNNVVSDFIYEGMIVSQNGHLLAENNLIVASDDTIFPQYGIRADVHNQGDDVAGASWGAGNLFWQQASQSGIGIDRWTDKRESMYIGTLIPAGEWLYESVSSGAGWNGLDCYELIKKKDRLTSSKSVSCLSPENN